MQIDDGLVGNNNKRLGTCNYCNCVESISSVVRQARGRRDRPVLRRGIPNYSRMTEG